MFKVIKGNDYVKTGAIIDDYRSRYGLKSGEAIPATEENKNWDASKCFQIFYKNKDLSSLSDFKNLTPIDNQNMDGTRWHNLTVKNTIFNKCNITDFSLHGAKVDNLVFLNCYIDILDLRYAKVNNLLFLYCGSIYGIKTDNANISNIKFIKSDIS